MRAPGGKQSLVHREVLTLVRSEDLGRALAHLASGEELRETCIRLSAR